MSILSSLKKACEVEPFEPIAPSWCIVHYLLLRHDGATQIPLGAVVAASATCSLFSYDPQSVAPMYFNTIGANKRMETVTGNTVENFRTEDAEQAFQFIKKGIAAGKGIFVSGPEMGLCYGYDENGDVADRRVYGFADWGPGFNGVFPWEQFVRFVQVFGNNEGFSVVHRINGSSEKEEIVEMIIETALDWQETHPAFQYGQKKEFYGLESFRRFIDDVSDPEKRKQIDDAYINCHTIEFQSGGRYWLGSYLKLLAQQFQNEVRDLIDGIGDLYIQSFEKLKTFKDFDILTDKQEDEVVRAIDCLREAYQIERKIIESFERVRKLI